jgi:hypothetical protein
LIDKMSKRERELVLRRQPQLASKFK